MSSAARKTIQKTDRSAHANSRAAALSKAAKLRRLMADGDKVVAGRFRTKMCRNFEEKGSCPYEARCMFAHGEDQLRTKQMNLSDGIVNEEAIREFKRSAAERTPETSEVLSVAASSELSSPRSLASPTGSTHPAASEVVEAALEPEKHLSTGVFARRLHWYHHNPYAWCAISPSFSVESRS